jgi:hypothetical protein
MLGSEPGGYNPIDRGNGRSGSLPSWMRRLLEPFGTPFAELFATLTNRATIFLPTGRITWLAFFPSIPADNLGSVLVAGFADT